MKLSLSILLTLFSSLAYCQNTGSVFWKCPFEYNLVKISRGGYYGLTDNKGNEILPLKYDEIEYHDSLIIGKINGVQYGFDSLGRTIDISAFGYETMEKVGVYIPAINKYVYKRDFSEGLMVITEQQGLEWKNRIAYIDRHLNLRLGFLKYSKGGNFHEGLARVYYRGYWGFIDKNGTEIIKPRFDFCGDFKEGLAIVMLDTLFGFIDTTGNIVIDAVYHGADPFCQGVARVRIDTDYIYIDKKGHVVPDKPYCPESTRAFCGKGNYYEGLAKFEENKKWGYIDRLGNIIIKPIYDDAKNFESGQAVVVVNNKYGVIDKIDNEVVKPQFVNYIYFQKNLIRIVSEDGKKFGIINRKGELIIPVEYDAISDDYRAGYYLVCIKNGKKGVVDADGKLIIPAKFNDIRLLDDNYFVCEIDKKHQAVYSKTGEYINEVKAEYINIQSECIVFKTNDRYGFYHYKTNYFSPPKFSSVNGFYNDTGIAYVGGAACHIDTKGNYITHPRFNHVEIFSEGLSVVRSGGTYGFMNNKGDLITPVMYEHAQRFSEGLALVKLKGKYGFIDTAGKAVIDFIYSEAGPFGDGLAAVKVGNYWGFINQQGEMVIEPQFDSVTQPFAGGRTYVVKNNRMFIINPKGKEVSR